jgi:hypothetical protein
VIIFTGSVARHYMYFQEVCGSGGVGREEDTEPSPVSGPARAKPLSLADGRLSLPKTLGPPGNHR